MPWRKKKVQINAVVNLDEDSDAVKEFMEDYIPHLIEIFFKGSVSKRKLSVFDEEFDIKSYDALLYAIRHLIVTKVRGNRFTIRVDKNLKFDDKPIMYYINIVTYGNREIKGYTILLDIFKNISDNINDLYNTWLMGIIL